MNSLMGKKIALLGNMNNNHFTLLRYLRDHGVDAYLLLYKNEIQHFLPETDTWNLELWQPFFVQTDLLDGFGLKDMLKILLQKKQHKKIFEQFDLIVGNGFAPGYSVLFGFKLDIWIPYHFGGEYFSKQPRDKRNWLTHCLFYFTKRIQIKGTKKIKYVVSLDPDKENLYHFKQYCKQIIPLAVPCVYTENAESEAMRNLSPQLEMLVAEMKKHKVLFSHVSHIWVNVYDYASVNIKQNDKLIRAFAHYLEQSTQKQYRLFLVEYGENVPESKQLIEDLGIAEYVFWCPKMKRKEIMYLMNFVEIGCGELGGVLWGGTGWEFMSKGIPFFQYVKMNKEEYESLTGNSMPPIYNYGTAEEIAGKILAIETAPEILTKDSAAMLDWYKTNNGSVLALKYIELLSTC